MQIETPSICPAFRCAAGRCPDTCCAGWEVDVDPDCASFYSLCTGPLADRIRSTVRYQADGTAFFPLDADGRCPFLDPDNLCAVIRA